jgi:uncharacterized protein
LRAILDPNVLIAALLSPRGSPARVFRPWLDGAFELLVSPALLGELERALEYPKLRKRISDDDRQALIELLRHSATVVDDPAPQVLTVSSRDPGDNYLLAVAADQNAALVSGDKDLLALAGELPIHSPATFASLIDLS